MNITILCSSATHPVNDALHKWIAINSSEHVIKLVRHKHKLDGGDILFLISCAEIITAQERQLFKKTLVIHASDLPRGRGWSPHIWELLNGVTTITVSLLEAQDKVDSGDIWKKRNVFIPKHALYDEINELLFAAEIELMNYAVAHFSTVQPDPQSCDIEATYYSRRGPQSSRLDPDKSIASQFDLLRVCDPDRFPAFVEMHGHKYRVIIEKLIDE